MPLYEYQCEACGHRFEVIQKMSDAPIAKCPSCGGAVHKLQSAPAFQFKGTGWYITDYARKDQESSKTGGSGENAKESSKSDKAPDSTAKAASSDSSSTAPSTPPASAPAKSSS